MRRRDSRQSSSHSLSDRRFWLLLLFFISGFAALVYQVLWARQLGLLFGNTAQAAAMAIAVFFAGIALGGWFWGRLAPRFTNSLKAFGWVEIGVAVTALGHFILIDLYYAVYPALYQWVGHSPVLDTFIKVLLTATVLLPPAFLMGGTLPLMGQYTVRDPERLGRTGSLLYAVNTAGAACGALLAGFYLPIVLGFTYSYLLAISLDTAVGLAALWLATLSPAVRAEDKTAAAKAGGETRAIRFERLPGRVLWTIAFASGFIALAVEVLWTRLFAQVLQNSVYTYALVLVVFLAALSLGGALANVLCRLRRPPVSILINLLIAAGISVAVSLWLFHYTSGGLDYIGSEYGWNRYVIAVATAAVVVMLLPAAVLGAVLPYLLRVIQDHGYAPGTAIGRLIAVNTTGAILGALAAGFGLLPMLGAGRALLILGAAYLLLASVLLLLHRSRTIKMRLATALPSLLVAVALASYVPGFMAGIWLDTAEGERLISIREGSHATVAVVERNEHLQIRVNNYYTLGGTGALDTERNQTLIPMLTHPEPRRVFYLGMGTGITAGAALQFPVQRVVICEILPEVIALAHEHFRPWTNGLFDDPRVQIYAEDGRNCLGRSEERYDLIISDLFTPWKAGTGNLYTYEHYRMAKKRLAEGGLFVQWLPLYQVSHQEFGTIARTMTEVFPQVVMWRGDLFPEGSIVALIGQATPASLGPETLVSHGRKLAGDHDIPANMLQAVALRFYAGNVSMTDLFAEYPLNTDNRPIIEYRAPRTQIEAQATDGSTWLVGMAAGHLYEALLEAAPLERDPYLQRLDAEARGYILAGRSYYHYAVLKRLGRDELAALYLQDFLDRTPFVAAPPEPEDRQPPTGWKTP